MDVLNLKLSLGHGTGTVAKNATTVSASLCDFEHASPPPELGSQH